MNSSLFTLGIMLCVNLSDMIFGACPCFEPGVNLFFGLGYSLL